MMHQHLLLLHFCTDLKIQSWELLIWSRALKNFSITRLKKDSNSLNIHMPILAKLNCLEETHAMVCLKHVSIGMGMNQNLSRTEPSSWFTNLIHLNTGFTNLPQTAILFQRLIQFVGAICEQDMLAPMNPWEPFKWVLQTMLTSLGNL